MAAILETRMGSHVGSFFLPKYKNVHYPTKTNKVQRKIIDIEKLNFLTTIYCGYLTKTTRKIITGSSGGMLLTDSEEAADKVRKWSTQSRERAA